MTNRDRLKQKHPEVIEAYEKLSHKEALEAAYGDAIDLINMEARVRLLMKLCTDSDNDTTYTAKKIKQLVYEKRNKEKRKV